MKYLLLALAAGLVGTALAQAAIVHTVFFTLKDPAVESDFKSEALKLAAIPGVKDFRWVKEVSPKNAFEFGLTMEFADQAAYDAYNVHPVHVRFVEEVWLPNVAEFLEVDWVEDID